MKEKRRKKRIKGAFCREGYFCVLSTNNKKEKHQRRQKKKNQHGKVAGETVSKSRTRTHIQKQNKSVPEASCRW